MIVSMDIETTCQGKSEFRFYRPGFQIQSIAASWRDQQGKMVSWFSAEPDKIEGFVRKLSETQKKLVTHNQAFEMGVFKKLYPDLKFNWHADTMRMAQLLDNGGDWKDYAFKTDEDLVDEYLEGKTEEVKLGLSLEAIASRFLPREHHQHKDVAHAWLEEHKGIKTRHGSHLHLLPEDVLREYNIADTETTLLLYETLLQLHTERGIDSSADWQLYCSRCELMQGAYIRGIPIDREALKAAIYRVDEEIKGIMETFRQEASDLLTRWAAAGSNRNRNNFNVGSNKQLRELFVTAGGLSSGKTTAKGAELVEAGQLTKEEAALQYPSFSSKHLKLWGPLGEILLKRRKRLLVLQQMLGVYAMSEETGRCHPEVRVSGTRTNRVSGGASNG